MKIEFNSWSKTTSILLCVLHYFYSHRRGPFTAVILNFTHFHTNQKSSPLNHKLQTFRKKGRANSKSRIAANFSVTSLLEPLSNTFRKGHQLIVVEDRDLVGEENINNSMIFSHVFVT